MRRIQGAEGGPFIGLRAGKCGLENALGGTAGEFCVDSLHPNDA